MGTRAIVHASAAAAVSARSPTRSNTSGAARRARRRAARRWRRPSSAGVARQVLEPPRDRDRVLLEGGAAPSCRIEVHPGDQELELEAGIVAQSDAGERRIP